MLMPLKRVLKRAIEPLIYRFPPSYLGPAGLYLWFDCLYATRNLDGVALEVGCYLGATAALGARYLAEIGSDRPYFVLDTFSGPIDEHVSAEVRLGGTDRHRHDFSGNTPGLARRVMDRHGGGSVTMIVGDITSIPEGEIPGRVAACLLDVGLAEPVHLALHRIYPRMAAGGIIMVDDCDDRTDYKARLGYERFIAEMGLRREITFGKGLVRVPHPKIDEPSVEGAMAL